ncbi:hypothetical protein E2C01_046925 [Portunus trituberculatus]|uniref:Uncharacterized protein n=1 Tax=Portunus trituberculatus TaxID=210409 RepID=A0A5B7FZ14_PORTR|nr:hypothetical protein [Portunus trituberculatus]
MPSGHCRIMSNFLLFRPSLPPSSSFHHHHHRHHHHYYHYHHYHHSHLQFFWPKTSVHRLIIFLVRLHLQRLTADHTPASPSPPPPPPRRHTPSPHPPRAPHIEYSMLNEVEITGVLRVNAGVVSEGEVRLVQVR